MIFRFLNYNTFIVIHVHTLSVFSDIAIGGLLAIGVAYNKRLIQFFENLPFRHILFIYIVFAFFIMGNTLLDYFRLHNMYWISIERVLQGLIVAFVLMEQSFSKYSLMKLSKFKWLSNQGRYTYGLYLFHTTGIFLTLQVINTIGQFKVNGNLLFLGYLFLSLIITTTLSYLSYHYWESPFLRLKDKIKRKLYDEAELPEK